jgi:DNA polymerase/3'-5' exonuclease PolX
MNYEEGLEYSNEITSLLFRYCMRIEPTGALRRKESRIHSVEMIAAPQILGENNYWSKGASDLMGEAPGLDRLDVGIRQLERNGVLKKVHKRSRTSRRQNIQGAGYSMRYREATVTIRTVTPPSEWGVEFLLCTGDGDFVDFLLRKATQKGFTLARGHLGKDGMTVGAPEEADVLSALGLEWIDPENRNRGFLNRNGVL